MTDISTQNYYYAAQIRRYIIQFMAIFSGLQVSIGKNDYQTSTNLITVPIIYGSMDRVVAAIKSENTQNKPVRVPIMSAKVTTLALDDSLRHGVGQVQKNTYLPLGSTLPDGLRTVEKYMPIPYKMYMELSLYASNTQQQFQMLEQIMMLFDPILQIQTSDTYQDWSKITTVTMEDIGMEEQYPAGTERRILTTSLTFSFPIYISPPVNIRDDVIKQIRLKVDVAVGQSAAEAAKESAPDPNGYEIIIDVDDLDIPEK